MEHAHPRFMFLRSQQQVLRSEPSELSFECDLFFSLSLYSVITNVFTSFCYLLITSRLLISIGLFGWYSERSFWTCCSPTLSHIVLCVKFSRYIYYIRKQETVFEWRLRDSNSRPPACKAGALPTELSPHLIWQPPAFPCRLQHSIIGRLGLNHRVRYGNGCLP